MVAKQSVATQSLQGVSVLITAGGKGTRLWPVSTMARPKQFCALASDQTMLQEAYDRAGILVAPEKIYVAVADNQVPLVRQQLPDIGDDRIIVEPESRDTAPAIAYATAFIKHATGNADESIIVFAADQLFENHAAFKDSIHQALRAARGGENLVSVGVVPTEPNTQYGYMRCGAPTDFGADAFVGEEYIEKPDLATAKKLVAAGDYIWNTNIFVWRADVLLRAYQHYQPGDDRVLQQIAAQLGASNAEELSKLYGKLTKISIDYGVMERVKPGDPFRHVFVKGHFGWTDIGNFDALADYLSRDGKGNRRRGSVRAERVYDSVLVCEPPYELVVSDLEGLIVAASDGNVLVMPRGKAAAIKQVLPLPLNHNVARQGERLVRNAVDAAGNVANSFVRLYNVKNSHFQADAGNIVCAVDVDDIDVRIEGKHIVVAKRTADVHGPARSLGSITDPNLGNVKLHVRDDYDAMSEMAAEMLVADLQKAIKAKGSAILTLSAGGTPEGLCRLLRTRYREALDWRAVTLFQMDDYAGLPTSHPQSLAYFVIEKALKPLGIGQAYFLNDEHGKLARSLDAYNRLIERHGGIDVIVHGIGENGHLGFNEPGTAFDSDTRIVDLDASTIKANSRFFQRLDEVPTKGVTIGFKQLMAVRKTYILASGPKKADAINKTLLGPVSESVPASVMQRHPDLVVIIDRGACNWVTGKNR